LPFSVSFGESLLIVDVGGKNVEGIGVPPEKLVLHRSVFNG
jgi:hypothetical protein